MGTRRLLTFLLLCGSLLAASACGGASASGGSFGDGAKSIPAGAMAYVDVNTDRDSSSWKNLEALGSRFRDWDGFVADVQRSLASGEDGKTFARVKDAVGSDAAIALTSVGTGGPTYVAAVDSRDDGTIRDELAKADGSRKLDGYRGFDLFSTATTGESASFAAIGKGVLLLSNSQDELKTAIDTHEGDGDSLADDPAFTDASGDFPDDSLANVWVDTKKIAGLASLGALGMAGNDPAAAEGLSQMVNSLKGIDSLTASISTRSDGVELASTLHGAGAADMSFSPTLLDRVPGTAFAFLSAKDLGPSIAKAVAADPSSAPGIRQFEKETGISFRDELVPLLTGEHLLYLGSGLPVGGALILHPPDVTAAAATMHKLTRAVAAQSAGQVQVSPLPGGNGEQIVAGPGFALTWHAEGDEIVLSTDAAAGKPAAEPITDSAKFRDLLGKAGAPDDAKALFYLDTPGLLKMAPSELDPNLRAIGGLVGWQQRGSDSLTSDLFLEIRG